MYTYNYTHGNMQNLLGKPCQQQSKNEISGYAVWVEFPVSKRLQHCLNIAVLIAAHSESCPCGASVSTITCAMQLLGSHILQACGVAFTQI